MKELSGLEMARLRPEQIAARKNDPGALKAAAREMESQFLYELIKTMRESVHLSSQQGFGNSTYTSMFDMELAKVLGQRGIGIADMLLKGMRTAQSYVRNMGEAEKAGDAAAHPAQGGKEAEADQAPAPEKQVEKARIGR